MYGWMDGWVHVCVGVDGCVAVLTETHMPLCRPTTVHRFYVKDSVEERIYNLLNSEADKTKFLIRYAEGVVDAYTCEVYCLIWSQNVQYVH